MEMLVKGIRFLQMVQNLPMHQTLPYCLMNDIPIDNENVWNFPSDFTGSITSSSEHTDNMVYMIQRQNTIYVYNRYQLELMKGESSDSEPVMSEDYIAEKVGMGQVFTLEDGSYLTLQQNT